MTEHHPAPVPRTCRARRQVTATSPERRTDLPDGQRFVRHEQTPLFGGPVDLLVALVGDQHQGRLGQLGKTGDPVGEREPVQPRHDHVDEGDPGAQAAQHQ